MTEENDNQIAIDIQAEQQAFTSAIQGTNNSPSSLNSIQNSTEELPTKVDFSASASPSLPPSISYVATPLDISHQTEAQVSKVAVDLTIKFDPEKEYDNIKKSVEELQSVVDSMNSDMHDRWIPFPRALNNFEERPTLEQTNLVFRERRDRFSQYPRWA
jgi:hypothetical protein